MGERHLGLMVAAITAGMASIHPRVPVGEYDPAFMGMERLQLGGGRKRKPKVADPKKKAARKRQKKARAQTRRAT